MSTADAPVTVVYEDPVIFVHVEAASTVGAVVDAVCLALDARCERLPAATSVAAVPAQTIRGNWDEVLNVLLKPTGVGYGTAPGGSDRAPQLFVSSPSEPRTGSIGASSPGDPPVVSSLDVAGSGPEYAVAQPETETVADSTNAPAEARSEERGGGAPGAEAPRMVGTPFGGPDGRPLSVAVSAGGAGEVDSRFVVTPFADESGTPVILPRIQDHSGVTPFVGPDGQPIYVQPNPDQGKLEFPIPAHMPKALPGTSSVGGSGHGSIPDNP